MTTHPCAGSCGGTVTSAGALCWSCLSTTSR